jgi:anti-sigma regulatory factor (Ser/Thr protein kinase)
VYCHYGGTLSLYFLSRGLFSQRFQTWPRNLIKPFVPGIGVRITGLEFLLLPFGVDSHAVFRWRRSFGYAIEVWPELKVSGSPYPIGSAWEQALVRITEESLTNTLKHADARKFDVELNYRPEGLRLRLRDDGIGFDYKPDGRSIKTAPHESEMSGGLGLLGIEERSRQLGGKVQIASCSGSGTTIEVIVPRRPRIWRWVSLIGRLAKPRSGLRS